MSTIRKIQPSYTYFFGSSYLQTKAASTRNKTIDAMYQEEISQVVYRYLQTRSLRNTTSVQTALMIGLELFDACAFPELVAGSKVILALNVVTAWLAACAFESTIRFAETAGACEQWLIARLGQKTFDHIKLLPFTATGLSAAAQLIDERTNANYLSQKSHHMYCKR